MRLLLALAVLIGALFVSLSFGMHPGLPVSRTILFVGNSYTYGGDVPEQVRRIAASADPGVGYRVKTIAFGGATLSDHLAKGDLQREIESGNWQVLVVQEQSGAAFRREWRKELRDNLRQIEALATAKGMTVIGYAHWAPGSVQPNRRTISVEMIEEVYRGPDTMLARVGALWQRAEAAGITGLYGEDGHHASLLGAYAAALAITAALGDVDVSEITWAPGGVSTEVAATLRDLAVGL